MPFADHMIVIEIGKGGGTEVLKPGVRPLPPPKPDEVLVKVAFAGVNGPDIMQRKGLYPPPPGASDLLGLEISGTVVSGGANVTRWRGGDGVCALTKGDGYAKYCVVDADHCLPIPNSLDFQAAASLPEPGQRTDPMRNRLRCQIRAAWWAYQIGWIESMLVRFRTRT